MEKHVVSGVPRLNGVPLENSYYSEYHRERIGFTLRKLEGLQVQRVLEVGGHPWAMTTALIERGFDVVASISAEEVCEWPDDIGVTRRSYTLETADGRQSTFNNYSANVERTLFDIEEEPDTVLACEIIEHLVRAPHTLLLNANQWLPPGGKLVLTTPNGAQFMNPFAVRTPTAGYRSHIYSRHHYLYTLDALVEAVRLAGFRITEAGLHHIRRPGWKNRVRDILRRVPLDRCRQLFSSYIYVAAEKQADCAVLERVPPMYDRRDPWEYIGSRRPP